MIEKLKTFLISVKSSSPFRISQYTDRFIIGLIFILLFAVFFFPVHLYPHLKSVYEFLLLVAGFIFILNNKLLKTETTTETPIDGLLFLLFIWYIVSVFFSSDVLLSVTLLPSFLSLLLLYYIVYSYSRKYLSEFIYAITAVVFLLSLYGIYQYFIGFEDTLSFITKENTPFYESVRQRLESKRIFSTLIYPNAFAGLLILTVPVVFAAALTRKKALPYMLGAAAVMTFAFFLTQSMGAAAALAAGLLIILFSVSDASLKKTKAGIFFAALAVTGTGLLMIHFRGTEDLINSFREKAENFIPMIKIMLQRPLTGFGHGAFEHTYNIFTGHNLRHAHNGALQAAIETGLTGLIIILLLIFRIYRSVLQHFYFIRSAGTKAIVVAALIGITAFLFHNLVDFDIYNFELAFVFTIICALLTGQITTGILELKRFKLSYLLAINPSSRKTFIYFIILAVLTLSVITGGKQAYVFAVISLLISAGFFVWAISKEDFRFTGIDLPLVLFMLLSAFSLFYTPDIHTGIRYFRKIFMAVIVYYMCSQFLRRYDFRIKITNYIIILGLAVSAAAFGQYIYRFFTGNFIAIDAFFPNQHILAGYMLISFALVLNKILFEKKILMLWPKIISLLIFALTVGIAHSKGAALSLIAVFVLTWIYYIYYRHKVKDTPAREFFKSRLLKISAAVLLIGAFTGITPSGSKMINLKGDPFYFNRAHIYKSALLMGADKPLTGHGLGSFKSVFPRYNFPIDSPARYQMRAAFAHNEFLQIFAALGIFGFILVLVIFFRIFRNIPAYEGHKKLWSSVSGAYFALCGIFIHSFTNFTLHSPGILLTAAALTGIITPVLSSIKTVSRESLTFTRIYYFPALILLVLLVITAIRPAAAFYFNEQYSRTGSKDALSKAIMLDPLNSRYRIKKADRRAAEDDFEKAVLSYQKTLRSDKNNYTAMLKAARIYSQAGNYDDAASYYELALKANPYRAFTYAEYADFCLGYLNNEKKAAVLLEKAVKIEPHYASARNNLHTLYKKENKLNKALDQLDAIEYALAEFVPSNDFEANILYFPSEHLLYMSKASLLRQLKRYRESCFYYSKALDIKGDYVARIMLKKMCAEENISACCNP
ncbi:MAG: O-antigen ligase family protein [Candidatus Goldiibacteriota bacterium]